MFIKIQHLKEQSDGAFGIGKSHFIECDEYVKRYIDEPKDKRMLVLDIIRKKEKVREMVFNSPNLHIDFFIMNSCGKTIDSFTYKDKKLNK